MCFPSSLTDSEWQVISSFLPAKTKGKYCLRSIVNALFYLVKTGCQWRYLPLCFPPWQTVYYHFRRFNSIGLFSRMKWRLRTVLRQVLGRNAEPSAAVIDSQSVRTVAGINKSKGWDGAKKLVGRKRHLVTDTLGFPLAILVTSAKVSDSEGMAVISPYLDRAYNLKTLFADSGYRGVRLTDAWLEIVTRSDISTKWNRRPKNIIRIFEPVPKRWVVERSFAWLGLYRRLSKDFERRVDCSEAMMKVAFVNIMLKRLTKSF